MGNNLVKASDDSKIDDTILGKNVKKVLKNIQYKKGLNKEGEDVWIPINKHRACCLGVAKENPGENDFITVKLPYIEDGNVEYQNLGLQFDIKDDYCKKNNLNDEENCNSLMINNCAKSFYDMNCLKPIEKNEGDKIVVWNAENKKCFRYDGSFEYGPEECSCVNSFTGFSLNTAPSSSINDPDYTKRENPYGVDGSEFNSYTKYSANLFKYSSAYQKPNVLDTRCAASIQGGDKKSGKSKPFSSKKLGYNAETSICLNQINIGDSNIGEANFKNIKQENVCGGGVNYKKNEKPKEPTEDKEEVKEEVVEDKVEDKEEVVEDKEEDKDTIKSDEVDELKAMISELLASKKAKEVTTTDVISKEEADKIKEESKEDDTSNKVDELYTYTKGGSNNYLILVLLLIIILVIIFIIIKKVLK